MVDTPASQLFVMRAAYLFVAGGILFFQLLPLSTTPPGWAGPDLLIALTFAWALRRPDFVPAILIAFTLLFADLMLHRAPGLMALLVLLTAESLKRRAQQVRNEGFVSEMVLVATALAIVFTGTRVVMSLLLIPQPPLLLSAIQAAMTLACYPVVVLVTNVVFGVRVQTPGDEATGSNWT